jgi:hypothetical protein
MRRWGRRARRRRRRPCRSPRRRRRASHRRDGRTRPGEACGPRATRPWARPCCSSRQRRRPSSTRCGRSRSLHPAGGRWRGRTRRPTREQPRAAVDGPAHDLDVPSGPRAVGPLAGDLRGPLVHLDAVERARLRAVVGLVADGCSLGGRVVVLARRRDMGGQVERAIGRVGQPGASVRRRAGDYHVGVVPSGADRGTDDDRGAVSTGKRLIPVPDMVMIGATAREGTRP